MEQGASLSAITTLAALIKAKKIAKIMWKSPKLLQNHGARKALALVVCKIQKPQAHLACPIR